MAACVAVRVRVKILGSQNCGIVGKYQSVLVMINPNIFTRTRMTSVAVVGGACAQAWLVDHLGVKDWVLVRPGAAAAATAAQGTGQHRWQPPLGCWVGGDSGLWCTQESNLLKVIFSVVA
jgi:hypothetical protein